MPPIRAIKLVGVILDVLQSLGHSFAGVPCVSFTADLTRFGNLADAVSQLVYNHGYHEIMIQLRGDVMAISMVRGKYRIQVSLTEEEYKLLRWMAYERELSVNELLRVVTLEVARDLKQNG